MLEVYICYPPTHLVLVYQAVFSVDISINQINGIAAGKMINRFLEELPALRAIVLVIKSFLHQRSMNEVFSGGLGSYSIVCLAVSFLQVIDFILAGKICLNAKSDAPETSQRGNRSFAKFGCPRHGIFSNFTGDISIIKKLESRFDMAELILANQGGAGTIFESRLCYQSKIQMTSVRLLCRSHMGCNLKD